MSWKKKFLSLIEQGNVVYRWQGLIFSDTDMFSRLDKTYLYLIKPDATLQRLVGYVDFNEYGETVVKYTTDTVYKIRTGKRKGRVVPAHKIGSDERFETATLYKHLEVGKEADCLDDTARGDSHILDILKDNENISQRDSFPVPTLYVCTKDIPPVLSPRQSGEAFTHISSLSHYDTSKPLNQNLKDLAHHFAVSAGAGRQGYPFEYMYGKGVIAADTSNCGGWCSSPIALFDNPLGTEGVKIILKVR